MYGMLYQKASFSGEPVFEGRTNHVFNHGKSEKLWVGGTDFVVQKNRDELYSSSTFFSVELQRPAPRRNRTHPCRLLGPLVRVLSS